MTSTTSIRIDKALYDLAKADAATEHRTISGQIEFWAAVGRAALDNPDLPVSFIAESLAAMAEPREQTTAFVPRSRSAT
ncbi:ParD-like family protein [Paraherbaspirillum soli]|uniref:ParD-like family protein n=1 Tax=Paraherbaspirillum soli TaxID=631222 RepID=A0ABW0MAF3_9BURK